MNHKYFLPRIPATLLALSLLAALGCRQGDGPNVSASEISINAEAQKAAQRFADLKFIKCGDASYATDGGQIWELRNMKVVARPERPELAAMHEESRKRRGVDWDGAISFECTSGRIYNSGWMNWGAGACGYNSVHLVHQKGVWLYDTGLTLEQLQQEKKPLSCAQVPQ